MRKSPYCLIAILLASINLTVNPRLLAHEELQDIQFQDSLTALASNPEPLDTSFLLDSPERDKMIRPDEVILALGIKPGMEIADIGAGTGYFTIRIAKALNNGGRVFATELQDSLVNKIKAAALNNGLSNVEALRVQPGINEPFYKQHSFDIIFMAELFNNLQDPVPFFKALRPSLKKNNGRLFILNYGNTQEFNEIDFDDITKILTVFKREDPSFPLNTRLDHKIKQFILNSSINGTKTPPELKKLLLRDFNRMLYDQELFMQLLAYYSARYNLPQITILKAFCRPCEYELMKWLITALTAQDTKQESTESLRRNQSAKLNKIVLSRIFSLYKSAAFRGDGLGVIYKNKEAMVNCMRKAGLDLARDHKAFYDPYLLEFKAAD